MRLGYRLPALAVLAASVYASLCVSASAAHDQLPLRYDALQRAACAARHIDHILHYQRVMPLTKDEIMDCDEGIILVHKLTTLLTVLEGHATPQPHIVKPALSAADIPSCRTCAYYRNASGDILTGLNRGCRIFNKVLRRSMHVHEAGLASLSYRTSVENHIQQHVEPRIRRIISYIKNRNPVFCGSPEGQAWQEHLHLLAADCSDMFKDWVIEGTYFFCYPTLPHYNAKIRAQEKIIAHLSNVEAAILPAPMKRFTCPFEIS